MTKNKLQTFVDINYANVLLVKVGRDLNGKKNQGLLEQHFMEYKFDD